MIGKKKKITQYVLNLTHTDEDSNKTQDSDLSITAHSNPKTPMLFVKIDGDRNDGAGLLGKPYTDGRLLGHDGVTDMSHKCNEYGEEWQARDTEPFQEHRSPQYPDPCVSFASDEGCTKATHNLRRRLLDDGNNGMIPRDVANDACADYVGVNRENRVHDMMVMGDVEVADDPSYNN